MPATSPFRTAASTPFVAPRVAEGQFEPRVRYCRNPVTGGVLPRPAQGAAWSEVDTEVCLSPTPGMSIRERVMRGWGGASATDEIAEHHVGPAQGVARRFDAAKPGVRRTHAAEADDRRDLRRRTVGTLVHENVVQT